MIRITIEKDILTITRCVMSYIIERKNNMLGLKEDLYGGLYFLHNWSGFNRHNYYYYWPYFKKTYL
ncbi:hypothetical protein HMI01_20410 [Halolactibacillus miurensis]|uniref:Uncharacterized protein n=1 Tax=Halolactibacillus miurensis TaxID=306541 RepID=A0ABQ0VV55_9BACI|nr:hypothetical protein HMI01_20410 [Halolactibacillus miurensis]